MSESEEPSLDEPTTTAKPPPPSPTSPSSPNRSLLSLVLVYLAYRLPPNSDVHLPFLLLPQYLSLDTSSQKKTRLPLLPKTSRKTPCNPSCSPMSFMSIPFLGGCEREVEVETSLDLSAPGKG